MPSVLRREGDTTNPQAARPVGEQSTAGQLTYWKQEGNRTYLITTLGLGEHLFRGESNTGGFRSEGFFDSITWYRYRGFNLAPYDVATDTGDYIFHKGFETDPVLGYADPLQGRPHFFPELDFCFSGRPYCETRLPTNLSSDGKTEPTESEIRLKTSCLWDYDSTGARVGELPTFTSNNARVLAFAARLANMNIATRFDWPSWVSEFRDVCDYPLPWPGGEGDGLTGEYFDTIDLSGPPISQLDRTIDFDYGVTSAFSRRWTGLIKPPDDDTYTFFTVADDGVRLWVNDVLIIDDWTTHAALERSGTIALTGGQTYSIKLEYFQNGGPGSVKLQWASTKITQQIISQTYLFSSQAVIDEGRTVERFDCDVVYMGVPWPAVFDAIMLRAPSVKWQSVNGKIRFMQANSRTPVKTFIYETGIPFTADPALNLILCETHGLANGSILRLDNKNGALPGGLSTRTNYYVRDASVDWFKLALSLDGPEIDITSSGTGRSTYTMRSNIVLASVVGQRTDPIYKPNFLVVGYRNKDDSQFVQGYAEVNRDDIREQAGGKVNDPGIVQIGVARQSLAERIAESMMRKASDRDTEVKLRGQKDSDEVAKHDLAWLIHPRGDWRLTPFEGHVGKVLMEVVDEKFESTITTANEKSFILKIWRPEYDDFAHGPLFRQPPGFVPSPFNSPPPVTNVTLVSRTLFLPDGTSKFAIDGLAQASLLFAYDQRLRVWWKKPDDEKLATANAGTDVITSAGHEYINGTAVLFRSAGTLPAGLAADAVYFVINATTDTFKVSAQVSGAAVDITDAGTGAHYVAKLVPSGEVLTPSKPENQAAFTLNGTKPGVYGVVVVAESTFQQRRSFEQHPLTLITITLPPGPTPTSFTMIFDPVTEDGFPEWVGESSDLAPNREIYDFEITDSSHATTLRPATIIPTQIADLHQRLTWEVVNDDGAFAFTGAAATDLITLPGGIWPNDYPVTVLGSSLPAPLEPNTVYYVRDRTFVGPWTIKLAATPGGPAIDLTSDGSGDMTATTLLPEGGLNFSGDPIGVEVRSKQTASPNGGLYVEFQIPEGLRIGPLRFTLHPVDQFYFESDFMFQWVCIQSGALPFDNKWYMWPQNNPAGNIIPAGLRMAAGDRFGINIRPDNIVEYHLNRMGKHSQPIVLSPRQVKSGVLYRVTVTHASGGAAPPNGVGIRQPSWVRQGPEWRYHASAQKEDNAGVLPAIVYARVRQRSFYIGGDPSPWVNGTFAK